MSADLTADANNHPVDERVLGIVLAAVLCSIAIGLLPAILCLAYRRNHNRQPWATYSRPASGLGDEPSTKPLRSLSGRKLYSSRSANAPEVAWNMYNTEPAKLSISRRPSLLYANQHSDSKEMLANIDESPQLSPLNRSHQSILRASRPQTPDNRSERISLSRYHSRSIDLFDAASRYSDSASIHRNSGSYTPHRQSTSDHPPVPDIKHIPSPSSPPISPGPRGSSQDNLTSPLVPTKNPQRRLSPMVHYPSWNEVQDFDFSNLGMQTQRPHSIQRRSSDWRPGSDHIAGRYELV